LQAENKMKSLFGIQVECKLVAEKINNKKIISRKEAAINERGLTSN